MSKIIFTDTLNVQEEYLPKPASLHIPEWYKSMNSYINNEKKPSGYGKSTATIKRCMPVFDAIIGGYIITTYSDVFVSQVPEKNPETGEELGNTIPWYEWSSSESIQFHPIQQAPTHPNRNGHQFSYPKWINPWGIKTPPGYSTLFIAPMHRKSLFTILPGIVDTDVYTSPVNFPFVLNDIKFQGLIPAGTPIAQVIPFKRDSWKMEIGSKKEIQELNKINNKLNTRFFDRYKTMFRIKKEYN